MRKAERGKVASRLSSPMSPSLAQDDDAPGRGTRTTASASSASSCFALACHVWLLCLLHVVLVFSSVAVAAAVVVLLPLACMAASLCLVCAITALLLAPCFAPPDEAAERGGSDNDGASSTEEEEREGAETELEITYADGAQFNDACADDREQLFWVDAGSYYCYKKFYDLLVFWRRKERAGRR